MLIYNLASRSKHEILYNLVSEPLNLIAALIVLINLIWREIVSFDCSQPLYGFLND
jgi:hypothetical protein